MNIFILISTVIEVLLANEPAIMTDIQTRNWGALTTLLAGLAAEIVASLSAKADKLDKAGVKL
jgi:hypothetical protein